MRWILYLGLIGVILGSLMLTHGAGALPASDAAAWANTGYSLTAD